MSQIPTLPLNTGATIPSSNPARMAENADIFDWELTDDELHAISALERPGYGVDSDHEGH